MSEKEWNIPLEPQWTATLPTDCSEGLSIEAVGCDITTVSGAATWLPDNGKMTVSFFKKFDPGQAPFPSAFKLPQLEASCEGALSREALHHLVDTLFDTSEEFEVELSGSALEAETARRRAVNVKVTSLIARPVANRFRSAGMP